MDKIVIVLSVIYLTAASLPRVTWAQWQRVEITTSLGWIQQSQVGEGRNDNVSRIYVASPGSNGAYEFTWNGATWDQVQVLSSSDAMRDLFVGEGRNDGVNRVYSTGEALTILESTWTGAIWDEDTVGLSRAIGVAVGLGRNDDTTRVYASSQSAAFLEEHSWQGSAWTPVAMQGGMIYFGKPALGNGRNDDTTRVYAPNTDGSTYEFTWNGSTWDVINVGTVSGRVNDLELGAGRNDGLNRIYCGDNNGSLHEYTWDGNQWLETSTMLPSGSTYLREVHVGNGRNDGVVRVYCAGTGGLTEFSWSGSDWLEENMGDESDGLTIGDGRDDGAMHVYAANFNAFAEYTYSPGIVGGVYQHTGSLSLQISPNPFREETKISYEIRDAGYEIHDISLQIYDAAGRLVKDLSSQFSVMSHPASVTWNGTDQNNQHLPDGVYIMKFKAGNDAIITKLSLIR